MRQRAERSPEPQVEHWSELALIPVLATAGYYALPAELQKCPAVQFLPQILAYCSLALWVFKNAAAALRIGLAWSQLSQGLQWGLPVGVTLGMVNAMAILWVVPWLGYDIEFLRQTTHARMPVFIMLPWAILLIAIGVELNFRGFLLGRLVALSQRSWMCDYPRLGSGIAVIVSALVFSFDPFMVSTFKHLHWIAVWDGLVWGMIWVRTKNLYATIIAHAAEVIVMYSVLKLIL